MPYQQSPRPPHLVFRVGARNITDEGNAEVTPILPDFIRDANNLSNRVQSPDSNKIKAYIHLDIQPTVEGGNFR